MYLNDQLGDRTHVFTLFIRKSYATYVLLIQQYRYIHMFLLQMASHMRALYSTIHA